MKNIFVLLIKCYQMVISPIFHSLLGIKNACRFTPTCSEYAIEALQKHGVTKGILLGFKRIIACQPYIRKYQISNFQFLISNKIKSHLKFGI